MGPTSICDCYPSGLILKQVRRSASTGFPMCRNDPSVGSPSQLACFLRLQVQRQTRLRLILRLRCPCPYRARHTSLRPLAPASRHHWKGPARDSRKFFLTSYLALCMIFGMKNPHAVALGTLGGTARFLSTTAEQRRHWAKLGGLARAKAHSADELSKWAKKGGRPRRKGAHNAD